ncbi:MAG: glycosyl hydrolase 108 family protein [Pseudomonadota bacterium]
MPQAIAQRGNEVSGHAPSIPHPILRRTRAQTMLDEIMPFEGGFSNDPLDPGGKTNFGVTQKRSMAGLKAPKTNKANQRT